MEVLIIGAGRVGQNLARELIELGTEIIVLDSSSENLSQLKDLDCPKIEGMPLETSVLEKAGVERVSAVLCVSNNENMNVMVGQICHKLYNVPKIIVRTFNPENQDIYRFLGLETICSTSMTKQRVLETLGFHATKDKSTILGFPVHYTLQRVYASWEGQTVSEVEANTKRHVLAVMNGDELKLVSRNYKFQLGEQVVFVSLPQEE